MAAIGPAAPIPGARARDCAAVNRSPSARISAGMLLIRSLEQWAPGTYKARAKMLRDAGLSFASMARIRAS